MFDSGLYIYREMGVGQQSLGHRVGERFGRATEGTVAYIILKNRKDEKRPCLKASKFPFFRETNSGGES
jgi:hypothetical protein